MNTISLIGFGEVGERLCKDLLRTCDADIVVYDALFADPQSKPSQHYEQLNEPRVSKADSAEHAAGLGELIVSAVTAAQAIAAAQSVLTGLRADTWFMDLNSISPGEKIGIGESIANAGGQFLEVAVMSPIGPKGIATPMLLAGPSAQAFIDIAQPLGFTGMRVLSDQAGRAAASKMCRSVIVKGTEALITEALLAARHFGVEQTVLDSLSDLLPNTDWNEQARYMISRSVLHGTRRAEEMTEVAKTVQQANGQPWMSEACVARQQWAGALPEHHSELDLLDMLDALSGSTGASTYERENTHDH